MDYNEFCMHVIHRMGLEDQFGPLTKNEQDLVKAAIQFGIGPRDCACQIIDNRTDAGDVILT